MFQVLVYCVIVISLYRILHRRKIVGQKVFLFQGKRHIEFDFTLCVGHGNLQRNPVLFFDNFYFASLNSSSYGCVRCMPV